jgi:hypothetical protein
MCQAHSAVTNCKNKFVLHNLLFRLINNHYFIWDILTSFVAANADPSKTSVSCAKCFSDVMTDLLTMPKCLEIFLSLVHSPWIVSVCHKFSLWSNTS